MNELIDLERALDVLVAIHVMGWRWFTPAPGTQSPHAGQRFLAPAELLTDRQADVRPATPNLPTIPAVAASVPHFSSNAGDFALVLQRMRELGYRPVLSNPRDPASAIVFVRDATHERRLSDPIAPRAGCLAALRRLGIEVNA
jgi:hypothetical protein